MNCKELLIHDIKVQVIRKRIKNLYLKISSQDGAVSLAAPIHFTDQYIHSIVVKKIDWIRKRQIDFQKQSTSQALTFVSQEKHYFMGNAYSLEIIEGVKPSRVYLHQSCIVMEVPHGASKEMKQKLMDAWYRKKLQAIIPVLITYWEPIIQQHVNQWGIKKMKTRWGTCNPRARRIWLSLTLAKKPIECLEYVVLHEMVHLIERSHNHVFKGCMDKYMPNWRIFREQLKACN